MTTKASMNRRAFLKTSGVAGAGLLIGFYIPLLDRRTTASGVSPVLAADSAQDQFEPNAFLRIDPDGTITVLCPRSEMGQGVQTTAAMLPPSRHCHLLHQPRLHSARQYGRINSQSRL
jgi:isoquinoline 1-oxidoreductase subunit beta